MAVDSSSTQMEESSRVSSRTDSYVPRTHKSIDMVMESDGINEQSPLLPAQDDVEPIPPLEHVFSPSESDNNEWTPGLQEDTRQETKTIWYMFLLTLCMAGLQVAWAVELSNGSPYLLSLGISKPLLAFVWIAGPLSGTLVQPYVGIKSDRCRSRFGKRRPFMVGGAVATIISYLALGWTKELISGLLGLFGVAPDSQGVKVTAIVFAILMIYVLDFSINVIQAGIRAFIVDNAPMHQQDSANAWANRISGVGGIAGYLFGYIHLPTYFPFFGDTQFKVLCVLASLALIITLSVSCLAIRERDPRLEGEPREEAGGVFSFFKSLYRSIRKLPPQISKVCQVQFFAWIGWFPVLFYTTTYIAEIYVDPIYAANPDMTKEEVDAVWEDGTRVGTYAMFILALVTFAASVILPIIVASTYQAPAPALRTPMMDGAMASGSPRTPRTPGAASANGYFSHIPGQSDSPKHVNTSSRILRRIPSPEIKWLTLRRAWLLCHLFFFVLTWLTFFVSTTTGATILVAFIGIPWAMTNWAPFALIAAEISKRDSIRRGLLRPPPTRDGEALARGEDDSDGADQAGVVLGIHNVAVAAPQVVATLMSSVVFRLLQKPRGETGDDSVAWVLRLGGCAALVAAWMTRRVGEEGAR